MSEKVLVKVKKAGKITLPLEYLKAMGVSTGDEIKIKVEELHYADPTRDYKAIVISKA